MFAQREGGRETLPSHTTRRQIMPRGEGRYKKGSLLPLCQYSAEADSSRARKESQILSGCASAVDAAKQWRLDIFLVPVSLLDRNLIRPFPGKNKEMRFLRNFSCIHNCFCGERKFVQLFSRKQFLRVCAQKEGGRRKPSHDFNYPFFPPLWRPNFGKESVGRDFFPSPT